MLVTLGRAITEEDFYQFRDHGFGTYPKFGSSGLYLSEQTFACPYDFYGYMEDEDTGDVTLQYHWKFLEGLELNDNYTNSTFRLLQIPPILYIGMVKLNLHMNFGLRYPI